jgi:hypothetical protein
MATISNTNSVIVNNLDGVVAEGKDIIGGYFVTETIKDIPSYANKTGQLCYCTGTVEEPINKFYQYNGTE